MLATRAGNYQTLPAHHENYPPLEGGLALMSSPVSEAENMHCSMINYILVVYLINYAYYTFYAKYEFINMNVQMF